MIHDLRHAIRMLLKRPAFTVLAIVTLALGIGANTAMFTVFHGVLLKPLPYPSPDRIVHLWERTDKGSRVAVSNPNFLDWRERARSFDALAAYQIWRETVLGGSEPVFASLGVVTNGFFRVFGVAPYLGRTFSDDEMRVNGTPAVVVSYGFWERTLGANRALETLSLRLRGVSCRVVGVMPPGFAFPAETEIWAAKELTADTTGRTGHNMAVVGRLKEGVSVSHAAAEMNTLAAALRQEHPGNNDAIAVTMLPLHEALTGRSRDPLMMLLAAVGLVLLIACANVASMLLVQGEERRAELAIRAALGAGRARIVRQLLVENLLLSTAGAALGLLIAGWLVRLLVALPGAPLPRPEAIGIDRMVLLFAIALAFVTPLLFGLVPSFQIARSPLRDTLAEGGRSAASPVRARVRSTLVAAEVAVALLLLVGAALLIRSFANVLAIDAGFQPEGVVTAELSVPGTKYPDADRAAAFYAALLPRLRAVAGVRAAGAVQNLPLAPGNAGGGFRLEGDEQSRYAGYRVATDGYFEAMGIPLRRGRLIEEGDVAGRTHSAVVNEAFVERHLGSQDPIGKRFAFRGMDPTNPTFTIVGVVGNVRHRSLVRDVEPETYVAYQQQPFRTRWTMTVAIRAERAEMLESLVPTLRETIRAYDPDVPVRFGTLDDVVSRSIADRRFTMALLTAFAGVALLLAAIGIYGVLAYSVTRRAQEIGIRLALGAEPRSVVRLLIRSGMGAVLAGIAIGLAGSVLATRTLETFLFGVQPLDTPSTVSAVLVLATVGLLGAYLPARRATKVDPLVVLRRS